MKKSDIKIGAVVQTKIGEELGRVVVVRAHGTGRWIVRREDAEICLPKARSSAALRPA